VKKVSNVKIRTKIRGGLISLNHNAVKVRTKVRSGALALNHNGVKVSV
jgi:hypothetical protein